jgi:hypothetical protein
VKVELSKTAKKQLTKIPEHIVRKFALWVDLVRFEGLEAARAVPGFRDHALKGEMARIPSHPPQRGVSRHLHHAF